MNQAEAATLMHKTIEALGAMDAALLEDLSDEAQAMRDLGPVWERETILQLQSLRQTLDDLLRSTGSNLNVLTGLQVASLAAAHGEAAAWVR